MLPAIVSRVVFFRAAYAWKHEVGWVDITFRGDGQQLVSRGTSRAAVYAPYEERTSWLVNFVVADT